jgi:hypothetical protein
MTPLQIFAEGMTTTKIAELAAHRLDRLITQGKVDQAFNTHLEKINVALSTDSPTAFRAEIIQTALPETLPLRLEILFDANGKVLSFAQLPGGAAGANPQWTEADGITLIENALHAVMDHDHDANIQPFSQSINSLTLGKATYAGEHVALVIMNSLQTTAKLYVFLKLDGKFLTATIIE